MRLPWYQIDEDGITRGSMLGNLLGVGADAGIGLAVRLWRWALELSPDGDFTGAVPDTESLAAAVGWPIDKAPRLVTELQRVGFVATTPTLRVRGLERYRRTWEKNTRKKANSLISGQRVPETGANPAPKTETEKKETIPATEHAPKPKRARKPSAAEQFFEWLGATRGRKTQTSDSTPSPAAINTVFGKALVAVGRPELELRYLAYLNDPEAAAMHPAWPWEGFAKRWRWLKPSAHPATQTQAQVYR